MRDVGPYTRVGRVAGRENYAWVSTIFKHSGSILVKKKATLTSSEGSTILRGLAEPCLIDRRRQTGLKSTLCSNPSVCHVILDPRPSHVSFLQVKKGERA